MQGGKAMTVFKKNAFLLILILMVPALWAQQKFALVIGNANYTNFGQLRNTLNDANGMADTLDGIGFTIVDKLFDADLLQMLNAVGRLKDRLSESPDSYGFLFYSGHGIQWEGENYLIPANAIIPDAPYLRQMAVSVQSVLGDLNQARNALNIVVLDACRDFPVAWTKTANVGLAVVYAPADSIIMFAAAAGKTASDADATRGNGLFTSYLMANLKIPGLEVSEVFNRTRDAVFEASPTRQRPVIYPDYFGPVYLGSGPPPSASQTTFAAGSLSTTSTNDARFYFDRGERFRERNAWEYAIIEYNDAIESDRNFAEAYRARGIAYYNENDYDLAIADFRQDIMLNPEYALSYYNMGVVYADKLDYNTAITNFNQALLFNPNFVEVYFEKGLAHLNIHNYNDAVNDFSKAIGIDSKWAEAYFNRGLAYINIKDYNAAIADFTHAIGIAPAWAEAYHNRGVAHQQKGAMSNANADLVKAREMGYRHSNDPLTTAGPGQSEIVIDARDADKNIAVWVNGEIAAHVKSKTTEKIIVPDGRHIVEVAVESETRSGQWSTGTKRQITVNPNSNRITINVNILYDTPRLTQNTIRIVPVSAVATAPASSTMPRVMMVLT